MRVSAVKRHNNCELITGQGGSFGGIFRRQDVAAYISSQESKQRRSQSFRGCQRCVRRVAGGLVIVKTKTEVMQAYNLLAISIAQLIVLQFLPRTAYTACLPNSASLPGRPTFTPDPLVAGLPATFRFGTFPEYNTSVRISRAQLAVSKPAPFRFSLPLDLCLLGLGLCGTTLRGPRPQPSPVPFLLPNFAPQGFYSLQLDLTAVIGRESRSFCSIFNATVTSKIGQPLSSPRPGAATPTPTPTPPAPPVTAVSAIVLNLTASPTPTTSSFPVARTPSSPQSATPLPTPPSTPTSDVPSPVPADASSPGKPPSPTATTAVTPLATPFADPPATPSFWPPTSAPAIPTPATPNASPPTSSLATPPPPFPTATPAVENSPAASLVGPVSPPAAALAPTSSIPVLPLLPPTTPLNGPTEAPVESPLPTDEPSAEAPVPSFLPSNPLSPLDITLAPMSSPSTTPGPAALTPSPESKPNMAAAPALAPTDSLVLPGSANSSDSIATALVPTRPAGSAPEAAPKAAAAPEAAPEAPAAPDAAPEAAPEAASEAFPPPALQTPLLPPSPASTTPTSTPSPSSSAAPPLQLLTTALTEQPVLAAAPASTPAGAADLASAAAPASAPASAEAPAESPTEPGVQQPDIFAFLPEEPVCNSTFVQTFPFTYKANKQAVGDQPCICGSSSYSANTQVQVSNADASQSLQDNAPSNSSVTRISFSLFGVSCNMGDVAVQLNGMQIGILPAADFDCACGVQCVTKSFTRDYTGLQSPYLTGQINTVTIVDDPDYTLFTNGTMQVQTCLS